MGLVNLGRAVVVLVEVVVGVVPRLETTEIGTGIEEKVEKEATEREIEIAIGVIVLIMVQMVIITMAGHIHPKKRYACSSQMENVAMGGFSSFHSIPYVWLDIKQLCSF